MTVYDIVKQYLQDNGYDGLCNKDHECGCWIDDLLCCDEIGMNCEPAYRAPCGICRKREEEDCYVYVYSDADDVHTDLSLTYKCNEYEQREVGSNDN